MSKLVPPYRLICDKLRNGRVIPFLGAGASLGGRPSGLIWNKTKKTFLPTAGELTTHLAELSSFPSDEPKELTKVAQYFNVVNGRQPLNEELHSIFDRDYGLTSVHEFLAEVSTPLLIVTTNYDDLIERAFATKGHEYDLIIHTTERKIGEKLLWWKHGSSDPCMVVPNKIDIDLRSRTIIYKMHGAVDRFNSEHDQYVITEDDYINFLVRMTKNKAVPAIFAEPFQTRHILFLGHGLRDWNLRVVLNRIENDLRRPKDIRSWAIQDKPSPMEKRFWQERGVEVFDMLIDDLLRELSLVW